MVKELKREVELEKMEGIERKVKNEMKLDMERFLEIFLDVERIVEKGRERLRK